MTDDAPTRPPGRPSDYDPVIAEAICDRLAMDESLVSICKTEGFPSTTTVYRWRDANPTFRVNYARARVDQGHTVADQMSEIRRQLLAGKIDPPTAMAMMQMIKWESGKRAPKEFGDKLALVGGGPGDDPIAHRLDVSNLTDEQLVALAGILGQAAELGADQGGTGQEGGGEGA